MCSCPPFECMCNKSRPAFKSYLPAYDMFKESLQPPAPFTQINITNAYPSGTGPSLDLFLHGGGDNGRPARRGCGMGMVESPRLLPNPVAFGQGARSFPALNVRSPLATAGGEQGFCDSPQYRLRDNSCIDNAVSSLGGTEMRVLRDTNLLQHRPSELLPQARFPGESVGDGAPPPPPQPLLLEDRFSASSSSTTAGFLSSSAETLFGSLSRMDDLYSMPGLKTEPLDSQDSFPCASQSQSPEAGGSQQGSSLLKPPAPDGTRPVGPTDEDSLFANSSCAKGGTPSLSSPQLLGSQTPDSLLDTSHADACGLLSSSHTPTTPTQFGKKFEELRPVPQRQFPGDHGPRSAFDLLHNTIFFRDDLPNPGASATRMREPSTSVIPYGQQYAGTSTPQMHMRTDTQMATCPASNDSSGSWYGRCPTECFQHTQATQSYSNLYKQACNHSINITLTYN